MSTYPMLAARRLADELQPVEAKAGGRPSHRQHRVEGHVGLSLELEETQTSALELAQEKQQVDQQQQQKLKLNIYVLLIVLNLK